MIKSHFLPPECFSRRKAILSSVQHTLMGSQEADEGSDIATGAAACPTSHVVAGAADSYDESTNLKKYLSSNGLKDDEDAFLKIDD